MAYFPNFTNPSYGDFPQTAGVLDPRPAQQRGVLGGGGFSSLLDPSIALPAAAAMIGGRNLQESLAGGFAAAAPGIVNMQKRKAINAWLKAKSSGDPAALEQAKQNLISQVPEIGQQIAAYDLTPHAPIAVSAGDRLAQYNQSTGRYEEAGGGAYGGTSMDAQNWNIIMGGKTDTPQYAAAYSQLFQTPKMAPGQGPNGEITQTPYYPPIPQGVKPPAAGYAAAAPAGPPAGSAGPVPQDGGVRVGPAVVTGQKAPNEQNIRNRELYSVVSKELPIVEQNFDELGKLGNQAAGMGGDATRWMASPGYQRGFMSLQTIVASYLYSTSGATANPGEVIKQTQVLMPAPGESAASVADKKARVRTMVEAIKRGASTTGGGDPAAEGAPAAGVVTHVWDPQNGLRQVGQ